MSDATHRERNADSRLKLAPGLAGVAGCPGASGTRPYIYDERIWPSPGNPLLLHIRICLLPCCLSLMFGINPAALQTSVCIIKGSVHHGATQTQQPEYQMACNSP
jgi:hypothetical protein